jgi:hypothetical protein
LENLVARLRLVVLRVPSLLKLQKALVAVPLPLAVVCKLFPSLLRVVSVDFWKLVVEAWKPLALDLVKHQFLVLA